MSTSGAMYRAVALWALRTNVALSDMHRLEQLANAAHIEFAPGDGIVLLNDEDVTERNSHARSEPGRVGSFAGAGGAPRAGGEAARDRRRRRRW